MLDVFRLINRNQKQTSCKACFGMNITESDHMFCCCYAVITAESEIWILMKTLYTTTPLDYKIDLIIHSQAVRVSNAGPEASAILQGPYKPPSAKTLYTNQLRRKGQLAAMVLQRNQSTLDVHGYAATCPTAALTC